MTYTWDDVFPATDGFGHFYWVTPDGEVFGTMTRDEYDREVT